MIETFVECKKVETFTKEAIEVQNALQFTTRLMTSKIILLKKFVREK